MDFIPYAYVGQGRITPISFKSRKEPPQVDSYFPVAPPAFLWYKRAPFSRGCAVMCDR